MSKIDILSKVYKLKNDLYEGKHNDKPGQWHDGAHDSLNEVLNILNEYAR